VLINNILIFCAMAGDKCARVGRSKPSYKHTAIDLEMKIRMIHKYEGGQCLSAITCEFGFVELSVNAIVKDGAHTKEHEEGMTMMKLIITKNLH
jgi:hypothetical protein